MKIYLHKTLFIHYFSRLEMESILPSSYTVKGELVSVGTKKVTVRCPRKFQKIIESRTHLVPVSDYFRRSKDEEDIVTFFRLKLLDTNYVAKEGENGKCYEVQFEVPEEASSAIQVDSSSGEPLLSYVPSSPASIEFWRDLNSALQCWFEVIRVKCNEDTTPITYAPLNTTRNKLKWTSKTVSAESFVAEFNPVTNKYVICVGVGYHSSSNHRVGISLQLGMFYALTPTGAYMKKVEQSKSKKRKVVALNEQGEEGEEVESVEKED